MREQKRVIPDIFHFILLNREHLNTNRETDLLTPKVGALHCICSTDHIRQMFQSGCVAYVQQAAVDLVQLSALTQVVPLVA